MGFTDGLPWKKPEKRVLTYFAKYLNILCHLSLDTLPFMSTYFFEGVLSVFRGRKQVFRCQRVRICESLPCDEEFDTYIDDSEYEKYPEY